MGLLSKDIGGVGKLAGAVVGGPIGAIAGAVAPDLIGGLLGGKGEQGGQTDLVKLRAQAEAAGFNPLTALQATGGNGFQTQGSAPLASTEMLTGVLRNASDVLTGKTAQDEARQDVQDQIQRVQLDQLRSGSGLRSRNSIPLPGGTYQSANAQIGEPYMQADEAFDSVGNPLTPALTMGGNVINTDQNTSDAEIWEQRYGDIAQEIAGLGILVMDGWKNRAKIGSAIQDFGTAEDVVGTQPHNRRSSSQTAIELNTPDTSQATTTGSASRKRNR